MTNEQIVLVQASFNAIGDQAEETAALFYGRLFEIDPELRPMFEGDLAEQGRKLMHMISLAVRGLSRLDELAPAVRSLGARHAGYGVRDSHYETVGSALLWTLEKGLGPAFTDETREAWAATYTLLAQAMKDGARAETTSGAALAA